MSSGKKSTKGSTFGPSKGEVNAHQELDPYRSLPGSFKVSSDIQSNRSNDPS
jgi:hypothetical protein